MRIIAGKYKQKKLYDFNVDTTRPTGDKVREALFSVIRGVENFVCLDLFAGTGAVGIEALSRGAKKCYFVESNINIYKIIVKNFQTIKVPNESVNLLRTDYMKALKGYKNKGIKFDFIFIDPPYKTDYAEKAIDFILDNSLLNENGFICWEHDKSKLDKLDKYNVFKEKKYGITYLSFLNNYSNNFINMQNDKQ